MKWAIIALCALAFGAAAADLRCGVVYTSSNSAIVACRAGRLP